jgi:hypothetical protein
MITVSRESTQNNFKFGGKTRLTPRAQNTLNTKREGEDVQLYMDELDHKIKQLESKLQLKQQKEYDNLKQVRSKNSGYGP